MGKYIQIIKNTWADMMTYRLNFVLWRVRWVIQRLVVYFLWWAIFSQRDELFGYSQSSILTYVLLTNIVGTFVLGTRTFDIGEMINSGRLSNFLIRPMPFMGYFVARDTADKLLNSLFAVLEIGLLFILLQPPVFVQHDVLMWILALAAMGVGIVLYFLFSVLLGFIGFWSADVWAPRFLSFVVMEFFAGGLFPLDILPRPLFLLAQGLPFSYFIYFPIKVYLGQISFAAIWQGLFVATLWIVLFYYLVQVIWRRGLRLYAAEGR